MNIVIYDGAHYTDKIALRGTVHGGLEHAQKRVREICRMSPRLTGRRLWVDYFEDGDDTNPLTHENIQEFSWDC